MEMLRIKRARASDSGDDDVLVLQVVSVDCADM